MEREKRGDKHVMQGRERRDRAEKRRETQMCGDKGERGGEKKME